MFKFCRPHFFGTWVWKGSFSASGARAKVILILITAYADNHGEGCEGEEDFHFFGFFFRDWMNWKGGVPL